MYKSNVFVIRSPFSLAYMVAVFELIRLWVAGNLSMLMSELLSIQMFIHYQMSWADKLQPSLLRYRSSPAHSVLLQHFGRAQSSLLGSGTLNGQVR